MNNKYVLFCDFCGIKSVIQDESQLEGLTELTLSPVPGGIPFLDPITKKTVVKKTHERCRVYKCRKCGRGLKVKKYLTPDSTHDIPKDTNEQKDIDAGRETGSP